MEGIQYDESFKPLPVAELLNKKSKYHFVIPSFQRGYRWERKQVTDLLDDIFAFCGGDETSYFLQPLVVKPLGDNQWEVLDGQQRLTTMLLILKKVMSKLGEDDREEFEESLYDITYAIRPELNFDSPDYQKTIDGFYLAEAKYTIDRWFKKKKDEGVNITEFINCLIFKKSASKNFKQVKFIWYAIPQTSTDLASINIFNRLNKGKIGLTSSELIKALFVLDMKGEAETASSQLVLEWNEMDKKFQDDKFWFFISNNARSQQTRIDLLFDFMTEKPEGADSDFSYRLFQNLFDYCHNVIDGDEAEDNLNVFWKDKGIRSLRSAWREVKRMFNILLGWYEDDMFYHYVGFLVNEKMSPMSISESLNAEKTKVRRQCPEKEWTRKDSERYLKSLIKDKFKDNNQYITREKIDALEYSNASIVRRLLLLFNIELCIKSGNQRFKFDLYKNESWDIEHVDSQNESDLQTPEDRILWLRNIKFILQMEQPKSEYGKTLLEDCSKLLHEFDKQVENERTFSNELYKEYYKRVNKYFSCDVTAGDDENDCETVNLEKKNKDSINNLTLLNSKINRSYKDAPFPYKRYVIIDNDRQGTRFIPIGTRNLFLKYFSNSKSSVSQLNLFRWNDADKKSYLESIHAIVDPIILD